VKEQDDFDAWLLSETLLAGLLGAILALFLTHPGMRTRFNLPELRLVLETTMALAGLLVAVLAAARFSAEGRRVDLLLASGFLVASLSAAGFAIAPVLGGARSHPSEQWAALLGGMLGDALIAIAPFVRGRTRRRDWAIANSVAAAGLALFVAWSLLRDAGGSLPSLNLALGQTKPFYLTGVLALQAMIMLVAVVGWGERFRVRHDDLSRWLALGFTLMLFAALQLVFQPIVAGTWVSQGDFLRTLAYAVILVGAWRAIRYAEFGRAVAEERARVAREIHDGLAQYLFAVTTHASMLESGSAAADETLARLKEAALLAQQEARFAILALSSASGTAPFDAALRRYVEFLTADGALDVELEVDPGIHLAPDEQIEIFRIVQEGLANVRKHAQATRADVVIGWRMGDRFVSIQDDGAGFDGEEVAAGQGLKNMRARAASIEGGFSLRSVPGRGTALEVVLRST
jgi:signal transduction histidine kinase